MEKSGSDNNDLTFGCGNEIPTRAEINLNVQTTTGGTFFLPVDNFISIDELKKLVANKLKVSKDKICLLHRERILQTGTLIENGVLDGSRIVLLPNVETGLLTQRPENSVMQALEALNEVQVTDFLSGKSPLNLTMRLGDHMMLIQLQLSTMNPVLCPSPGFSPGQTRSDRRCSKSKSAAMSLLKKHMSPLNISKEPTNIPLKMDFMSPEPSSSVINDEASNDNSSLNASFLQNQNVDALQNSFQLVKSFSDVHQSANDPESRELEVVSSQPFSDIYSVPNCDLNNILEISDLDQSPIKSLSNLVSSPLKSVPIKPVPLPSFDSLTFNSRSTYMSNSTFEECPDPICVNLTSCLCKSLQNDSNSSCTCQSQNTQLDSAPESASKKSAPSVENRYKQLSALLHKTANKNITKSKKKQKNSTFITETKSTPLIKQSLPSTSRHIPSDHILKKSSGILDSSALAEASRNLTQTLKKLSKEVLTNKKEGSDDSARKSGQGAVIESMKHHGKGIYSGTFSGTLNPALQDKYGMPKRDITTIIHILNDLLCATPQYKQGAKVTFEPADLNTIPHMTPRQSASSSQRSTSQIPDYNCSVFSNNSSTSCTYGECNGHYPGSTACSRSCCAESSTCPCSDSKQCNTCKKCASYESGFCHDCYSSCSLIKENYKTKCKVEQLRLIMQQKRQRREDRKLKVAPYSAAGLIRGSDTSSTKPVKTSVSVSSDSSPISVEEIDTLV